MRSLPAALSQHAAGKACGAVGRKEAARGSQAHTPPARLLLPPQEGGGRKGLPKSFLNRFTRVHVELLQQTDLLFIAASLHPRVPPATLGRMVAALQRLHHDANVRQASPRCPGSGTCSLGRLGRLNAGVCGEGADSRGIELKCSAAAEHPGCFRAGKLCNPHNASPSHLALQPRVCWGGRALGVQPARPAEVVRAGRVCCARCAGCRPPAAGPGRGGSAGFRGAALRLPALPAAPAHRGGPPACGGGV